MKQWFSALGLKSREEPIEGSPPEPEASALLHLRSCTVSCVTSENIIFWTWDLP